jgi:hypothetical protein
MGKINREASVILTIILLVSITTLANPNLTPGVWTNIGTASTFNLSGTFGTPFIEVDQSHPDTLYVCADQRGLWRSYNAGETWTRVGTPPTGSCDYKDTVHYLDSPIRVEVDPNNPLRLYATQGVRGCTQGFWLTTDGGSTWIRSKANRDACVLAKAEAMDNTGMDVDPSDFNHVLIAFHYYWNGGASGIFESKDGGISWIVHNPPSGMCCASKGVSFLYNPQKGIGNANTWLVSDDATDYWRTTDAGVTWSCVSTLDPPHGGIANVYYSKTGVLYAGCTGTLIRSTDNGATWASIPNTGLSGWDYGCMGDGNLLYAHSATTGDLGYQSAYRVSKEEDGLTWSDYKVGPTAQTLSTGPFIMAFDKTNRIMYSANWTSGIWALKVDTGSAATQAINHSSPSRLISSSSASLIIVNGQLAGAGYEGAVLEMFDAQGTRIGMARVERGGIIRINGQKIRQQTVIARVIE